MDDRTQPTMDLIGRMNAGDRAARDELFRQVARRFEALTRKMLRRFPGVARWCETGDVLAGAQVRLLRALEGCRPAGPREVFALASQQLRRGPIDLLPHHPRPHPGRGNPAPAAPA